MPEVYVGLGSNLEPLRHLRRALAALGDRFAAPGRSSVYRSPPYGFTGPDFLNMVVVFGCEEGPDRVDAVLTAIERAGGRSADRGGSRTLDLDLLLYGLRVDAARRLPRADVLAYPFVLAPLAELAPWLRHPVTGERIVAAWETLSATRPPLERLGAIESLG